MDTTTKDLHTRLRRGGQLHHHLAEMKIFWIIDHHWHNNLTNYLRENDI